MFTLFFIGWFGILPVLCLSLVYGVDYPPEANAGSDMILHLPKNYVTLNGSLSKDDRDSSAQLSYVWTKVTKGLPVDMEGTRTAVLHLSNLVLGDYTFKLEVTDTAGKTSSSYTHVFVKSAVCESSHSFTLSTKMGRIDSSDYSWAPCVEWMITGAESTSITLSFTSLHLDDLSYNYNCLGRNHIELGPLPSKLVCGPLSDENKVFISERNHVWIKLIRGDDSFDRLAKFQFQYIVSPPCYPGYDFMCNNGRCIVPDWKCNGANECGDWTDEIGCDHFIRNTQTAFPSLTTAVKKTPQPSYTPPPAYPVNIGDNRCKTVYCYVSAQQTQVCLDKKLLCDGVYHCNDGADEKNDVCNSQTASSSTLSSQCNYNEIYCWVVALRAFRCLHNIYKCDGHKDCYNGEDEKGCGDASCNRKLEQFVGWFTSPNYPLPYPNNKHCRWEIHVLGVKPDSHIQLRFVAFSLQRDKKSDYIEVYDGPDETYELLGRYDGDHSPPSIIESTESWMLVIFVSDEFASFIGFNATYQVKGYCLPNQLPCGGKEQNCYDKSKRCDEFGAWDCPITGADERLCQTVGLVELGTQWKEKLTIDVKQHCCKMQGVGGAVDRPPDKSNCPTKYSCGSGLAQCYNPSDRCDGDAKCSNNADEENCNADQCGSHNGTFLCDNKHCIYESWTCDQRDDCGDFSDEQNCSGSSNRVIIAAISGSVICALLLVILIGCSCKLYSLRTIERHGGIRHHSPMSRLYAEFLRRTAPPPYHEAMLTSRNYDEVQREQRERLLSSRRGRRSNGSRSNSQNNQISDETQTVENTADNVETAERENVNFVNEVEVTETGDHSNTAQQTTESSGVQLDRSNEATEDQNTESDTDSDSSEDQDDNDVNNENVISQDGIELQTTSLSSRVENLDDDEGSSDDSCILNHHSDCDGRRQDIDNQSISLDDISMETASASINLELTDFVEAETNLETGENDDSDKDLDYERENLINTRRDSEPKEDGVEVTVISGGSCSFIRNSRESLNSIHSNSTADSDEPLLVA